MLTAARPTTSRQRLVFATSRGRHRAIAPLCLTAQARFSEHPRAAAIQVQTWPAGEPLVDDQPRRRAQQHRCWRPPRQWCEAFGLGVSEPVRWFALPLRTREDLTDAVLAPGGIGQHQTAHYGGSVENDPEQDMVDSAAALSSVSYRRAHRHVGFRDKKARLARTRRANSIWYFKRYVILEMIIDLGPHDFRAILEASS